MYGDGKEPACNCCGVRHEEQRQAVESPDDGGLRTYYLCAHCLEHCTFDLDGRPVHPVGPTPEDLAVAARFRSIMAGEGDVGRSHDGR